MFRTPEEPKPTLKLKTPVGSHEVSFSVPQPMPERLAGRPKVLGLICTHPALLPLDTVMSSARALAERTPKAKSTRIVRIFIDDPPTICKMNYAAASEWCNSMTGKRSLKRLNKARLGLP